MCDIQAHLLRGQSWTGHRLGSSIARLGIQYSSRGIQSLLNSLYSRYIKRQITFQYSILTPQIIEQYLYTLRRKRITYLEGFVSPLVVLAKYVGQSEIKPNLVSVKTKGEMLYPNTRRFIERNLQCSVFESYGSGELGEMALECNQKNGLHVYNESYIIEVIRDGEPVVDEIGDLVITDLTNYTQPFIRYLIGDRGVITDEKCECGQEFQILKSIEGRANDAITCSNGTWLSSRYFWGLVEPFSSILQWQVEQLSMDRIIFRLVMLSSESDLETRITEAIAKIDSTMEVEFDYVSEIPKTKSGKLRNVVSRIKPETTM
ncbi:MAG: phenylacetate--CoA ligase family protein [Candidatus Thorarchaeota archaeon]|nr:phenylacetate--CoA ligase family protein [Candidatus Thorarchaeota archaeon]